MTQPIDPKMFYSQLNRYAKPYVPLATVPFLGSGMGSGIRYGRSFVTRTGVGYYRKRARKSFKASVMATLPAKHQTNILSISPLHNTLYSANITASVTQGTGNTNRIGDAIRLCALKLKGFVQTPTTATGMYTYRVIVGWSGEEYSNTGLAAQLTGGETFLPNTVTAWTPNGVINPKAFTVLYDKTFDVPTLVTTTADLASFNCTLSINQDFDYQSTASIYGKHKNLYVCVVGSVVGGTDNSTAAGVMYCAYDLIFK